MHSVFRHKKLLEDARQKEEERKPVVSRSVNRNTGNTYLPNTGRSTMSPRTDVEDFYSSFKLPIGNPVQAAQSGMIKKYKDIHQKSQYLKKHESISADMINAAETVNRVIEQCDPDDEKYNIRVLLEELNRLDILKKNRKSLVPMRPLSYTKREQQKEPEPEEFMSPRSCGSRQFYSPSMSRRPGSAPSCRLPSAVSVPTSVTRTIIGQNSHYLSTVIPSNTVNNFISAKSSRPSSARRPSSATHVQALKQGKVPVYDMVACEEEKSVKEQQLNDLLYDLVCEFHDRKKKGNEETEKEKKEYIALKVSFQRIYPLIKKHFQTYFVSKKEFGWNDQRVESLNKDIEEIALEEKIRDRVEQEHMEFLTKKLKVNQIRKTFKAQRQNNFLKRVVVSDPRALAQLQNLCNDDNIESALTEEREDWDGHLMDNYHYDQENEYTYDRPTFEIPRIDLSKTKRKPLNDAVSVGGNSTVSRCSTTDRNAHGKFLRIMNPNATSHLRNLTPDLNAPIVSRPSTARLTGRSYVAKPIVPPDECDILKPKNDKTAMDEIANFERRIGESHKKEKMW